MFLRSLIVSIKSTFDIAKEIAQQARYKRLQLNLSQQTLSEKSGIRAFLLHAHAPHHQHSKNQTNINLLMFD